MVKINISGKVFLFLVIIATLLLVSTNQVTIWKAITHEDLGSPYTQIQKEFELVTGQKQAGLQVGGCEIIEPVYAELQCNQVVSGMGGTQRSYLITPEGVTSNTSSTAFMDGVVKVVDVNFKDDFVCPYCFGVWNLDGKAYRIDWAKVANALNIRSTRFSISTEYILIETQNPKPGEKPLLRLWAGKLCTTDTYRYCGEYPGSDVTAIYIFNTKNSWIFWNEPVATGEWTISFDADDFYLTYTVPGQIEDVRIPSAGCNVPELATVLAQKAHDTYSGLEPAAQIAEISALQEIKSKKNYEGTILTVENIPDAYLPFYREGGLTYGPDGGKVLANANVEPSLVNPGDTAYWVYMYRNTGVVEGVTAVKYDVNNDGTADSVLCDQNKKRLLVLTKIRNTPDMVDASGNPICYSYPTTEFKKAEWSDPNYAFSCSQSFCTKEWSLDGRPKFDEANFRCVAGDVIVPGRKCIGPQDCQVVTDYLPISAGGNCMAFESTCVPDKNVPAPYTGICVDSSTTLPVCCPGERLASGAYCNSDGTGWVDAPQLTKQSCPAGMCCKNDAYYTDSKTIDGKTGTEENEYGCFEGNLCCADMDVQTRGTCRPSCGIIENPDTLADKIIKQIMDSLGLDKLVAAAGTFGTIVMWIIIILAVVVGFIILFYIIGFVGKFLPILRGLVGGQAPTVREVQGAVVTPLTNATGIRAPESIAPKTKADVEVNVNLGDLVKGGKNE